MATQSVATDPYRFTIRTSVGYEYKKGKKCKAGDTLLCNRNRLPKRGEHVVLIRHDGAALAWRCDCPPLVWQDGRYVFGFEKENGDVVYFDTSDFAHSGVVVDARRVQA